MTNVTQLPVAPEVADVDMTAMTRHEGANLAAVLDVAKIFVQSGFFADSTKMSQAAVKVMAGQELGFGPFASMNGIYIVKGRTSLSSNLMATAIKRTRKYNYRITEHTDKACAIDFFENGQKVGTSRFTIEDAKKAGTQNMDRFPRNMLFARALSNGAKWYCPDAFGGAPVYAPEDFGMEQREDGTYIEPEPEPVAVVAEIVDDKHIAEPQRKSTKGEAKSCPTHGAFEGAYCAECCQ